MFFVMAAYNPSGYSYLDWLLTPQSGSFIWKVLTGLSLAIVYATFGLATLRSLGRVGIAAWTAFFVALVWLLIDLGWIDPVTPRRVATTVLAVIGNVIAIGLSWSYIRARLSGQADTNNVTLA